MKLNILLFFFFVIFSSSQSQTIITELINPSFEEITSEGKITGWNKRNGVESTTEQIHSNSKAIKITASKEKQLLYQSVTLQPGYSYQFCAWIYIESLSGEMEIDIEGHDETNTTAQYFGWYYHVPKDIEKKTWVQQCVETDVVFKSGYEYDVLVVTHSDNSGVVYVDDVSFSIIPRWLNAIEVISYNEKLSSRNNEITTKYHYCFFKFN